MKLKSVTLVQIQAAGADSARAAIADAEARVAVLNERLSLLVEEREFHVRCICIAALLPLADLTRCAC